MDVIISIIIIILFLFICPQLGQYRIQDLDKVMYSLNKQYGKIAKVGGLIGHPDLLFIFDGDEIRNIFKKEETLPHRYVGSIGAFNTLIYTHNKRNSLKTNLFSFVLEKNRPSMPSLHHYKGKLRKDFFGDDAGLIGV